METKNTQDAIILCRLIFGQAVLELLRDKQQVTNAELEEKVRSLLPDRKPEVVYELAMKLLERIVH